MNDYTKQLSIEYEKFLEEMRNTKLVVNEEQLTKFKKVVKYFTDYITENGGEIEDIMYEPEEIHCGITCYFYVLDISGDSLKDFIELLQYCSAFTLDATRDGRVCVSLTVPDVYKK